VTCIKNFIKYAPDDFRIKVVGISADIKSRPPGSWYTGQLGSRTIDFFPMLHVAKENKKGVVPLSLRFFLQLLRSGKRIVPEKTILEYHRIEPALALSGCAGKQVLFVHGHALELFHSSTEVKWRRLPWLYFQIEKRIIPRMNAVYSVREDGVRFYQEKYPFMAGRFSFLPTWVDQDLFFPSPEEEQKNNRTAFLREKGLPGNSKLVLFVGRLESQKDPVLLIDTFGEVLRSVPEAILLIVGEGSLKGRLAKKIKQERLNNRAVFMGILPQEKVAGLMRISDAFLLTSAFEGMPRSALEALACGVPVVAPDVGEIKRVVHNGYSGFICAGRNAKALSDALSAILLTRNIARAHCVASIKEYTAQNILHNAYLLYYSLQV